jgi:DNA-directed RNA polymerase subunit RPC12/RpoP
MRRRLRNDRRPPRVFEGTASQSAGTESYGDFTAAELHCQRCKTAVPVRERLLLILPDGELYEYLCAQCGATVGEKTARGKENIRVIVP